MPDRNLPFRHSQSGVTDSAPQRIIGLCYNIPMISLIDTTEWMVLQKTAVSVPAGFLSKTGTLLAGALSFLAESFRSGLLGTGAGIGVLTAVVLLLPALWVSWKVAKKRCDGKKAGRMRKGIFSVFLVFPPALWGILLLVGFGPDGVTGRGVIHGIGWKGSYPWLGALLVAVLAALPVLRLSFQRALERTDPQHIFAARTLGIRKTTAFWRIALPGAREGVAAGILLGAARAAGEYGACALMAVSCLRKAEETGSFRLWTLSSLSGTGVLAAWIWDLGCLAAGAALSAVIGAAARRRKARRRHS